MSRHLTHYQLVFARLHETLAKLKLSEELRKKESREEERKAEEEIARRKKEIEERAEAAANTKNPPSLPSLAIKVSEIVLKALIFNAVSSY